MCCSYCWLLILLQTDNAHKDIDNNEALSDAPTVRAPSSDDHASDDENQKNNNTSVCLYIYVINKLHPY